MTRTVTILGATGSVGRSTLDLIAREPDRFEIVALTAKRDVAGLAELARAFRPRQAVIGDKSLHGALADALAGTGIEALAGADAVDDAAASGADWTMAAIVGTAGLRPVMRALEGGATVAFANKEALVSAGSLMMEAAAASGATLLPVDSEHNAIFQCLDRSQAASVSRIILTASGGPFRCASIDEMRAATPALAVAHPNWTMGAKISVDSATLMNKGLELIEAFHLFPIAADALEVVIHPQSVIHSLVEYVDGSVLAQLGAPDMRVPIAYTLAWPERMATPCARLDLVAIGTLGFEAPDLKRFPALGLARAALVAGGAKPAILNAANEIGVASFLESGIGFLDIASVVGEVLAVYDPPAPASIDEVLEIDRQARRVAAEVTGKFLN
ncbi:MAG TPA: 1-deoxy-D-xylulose-5-phosphate reductoisomerase [Allosphingosinicella sp.]